MIRAKQLAAIVLSGLSAMLGGCFTPNYVKVDTADHPKYIDKQVRFRGLYYFRVYDYCADKNKNSEPAIVADALYRFRMTGKANALTTSIKFEAGTLRKSEIDPFGSSVEYDPKSRRWTYVSHEDAEVQRAQAEHLDQALLFVEMANEVTRNSTLSEADKKALQSKVKTESEALIAKYFVGADRHVTAAIPPAMRNDSGDVPADGAVPPPSKPPKGKPGAVADDAASDAAAAADRAATGNACLQLARGFQILGPEGWREFDTDERLVLAMSSSAAPLVSTLKELSGRVLNASADPVVSEGAFAEEQLRTLNAEAQLTRLKADDSGEIVKALGLARRSLTPESDEKTNGKAP